MCDFRKIYKIKFIDTNKILDVEHTTLQASACQSDKNKDYYMDNITEPGFYGIVATGGFYGYFDGEKWVMEYSADPGGYYGSPNGGYVVVEYANHLDCLSDKIGERVCLLEKEWDKW